MPELPDVEIARGRLQRWIVGATVRAADCTDKRLTRPLPPSAFARTLAGQTIEAVARKGKWLRLALSDGSRLFSHLGMTGGWVRAAVEAPPRRFERARIDVIRRGRASSVRYVDSRRFGRLVPAGNDIGDWTALGPDPLSDGVDAGRLAHALAKGRRAVKEILMDQRVLAGVGNILATEALWMARLDPRSRGEAVQPADARAIVKALKRVIERELAHLKRKSDNREGSGSFFVYGRAGEPCPRCATRLSSVVLGGRTSVYCSHCQLLRGKRASRDSK